ASDSTATHYVYDGLGRMITQTDASQHSTAFEYDVLDRRTKRTLPDGTSYEVWEHDYVPPNATSSAKLNKVRHRDFAGRYNLTENDVMGRVERRGPDGQESGVTALKDGPG